MRRALREQVPEQEVAASVTATPPRTAASPTLTRAADPRWDAMDVLSALAGGE